jgi:hypothetical protein
LTLNEIDMAYGVGSGKVVDADPESCDKSQLTESGMRGVGCAAGL